MLLETQKSSQNHRMVQGRSNLGDHLIPSPWPWTGTHFTGPGCSKPHAPWPFRNGHNQQFLASQKHKIQNKELFVILLSTSCHSVKSEASSAWCHRFQTTFCKFICTYLRSIEHHFTLKQTGSHHMKIWFLSTLLFAVLNSTINQLCSRPVEIDPEMI